MKLTSLFLVAVLFLSAVLLPASYPLQGLNAEGSSDESFFGVTFGGNTTAEARLLIDKVKDYTNLFIINSWDITSNETALTEICDYATAANLNVMVFFSFVFFNYTDEAGNNLISGQTEQLEEAFVYYNYTYQEGNRYNSSSWEELGISPFHMSWLSKARERWGARFLGVYLYDEPGGKQIDTGYWNTMSFAKGKTWFAVSDITTFRNVTDYSDAAYKYVRSLSRSGSMQHVTNSSFIVSKDSRLPVFTSDYALYWFDYLAGYDAVFAEISADDNETRQIALCRGAANVQRKDWGAIIAWGSDEPPYLASGKNMLRDLTMAYYAGAKYLVVFNYPQINPYGALTEEHFQAMRTFWSQIHSYSATLSQKSKGEAAFVLPKDYGWGLRNPDDKIWGVWQPDALSPAIWTKLNRLIEKYRLRLDVVYDDPKFDFTSKYSEVYYWNSTVD